MGLDHLHQINNQQNVPRDMHIGQSDGGNSSVEAFPLKVCSTWQPRLTITVRKLVPKTQTTQTYSDREFLLVLSIHNMTRSFYSGKCVDKMVTERLEPCAHRPYTSLSWKIDENV